MRGVTLYVCKVNFIRSRFQLTRLMRGVTLSTLSRWYTTHISTHTPLARRDFTVLTGCTFVSLISTHTPLARRDAEVSVFKPIAFTFQLTRLLRGVTSPIAAFMSANDISTHTPLARRDFVVLLKRMPARNFNSHASCEA